MSLKKLFRVVLSNKIVWYMLTRYVTYGLSFIVTMYIASKMGPYYYGIWGFLLLVLNYFNLINWGIPQAVQVFLIQNKKDNSVCFDYEKTGFYLMLIASLGCLFLAIYYAFGGIEIAHKFNGGFLFYVVCICGLLNYVNLFYSKIYRARNRLFEISFQQTSVVVLMFLSMFWFEKESLLYAIVFCYLLSYFMSTCLYLFAGGANRKGKFKSYYAKDILKKGIFLFLYNSGFYLIIVSTKTLVSLSYSIEEFGLFAFAYLLGHAVFQLLEAFSFLLTTKLLYKYRSNVIEQVLSTISLIRTNFVVAFHGVMYLAMLCFPLLLKFLPQYVSALQVIYLSCLTMLLYTNSFGYSTFLVARNREKELAFISISTLFINLLLGLLLIKFFHVSFEYVILATMFAYFYYAILCVYYGRKTLGVSCKLWIILKDCFPLNLLIPFLSAVLFTFVNNSNLIFLPVLLFLIFNVKNLLSIYSSFKRILYHPNIIDV